MGGPRVSTGTDSKQDYATPPEFMRAVADRWYPISFDLAAHSGNARHERYFAPLDFLETNGEPKTLKVAGKSVPNPAYLEWRVPNTDRAAVALDAFKQEWHRIGGLLWLNPEFSDIAPWAQRCAEEARDGAEILLLVPAAVGSNWYRDFVRPYAFVSHLNGRISFDGKNGYPKDCFLAHYGAGEIGDDVWEWTKGRVHSRHVAKGAV